ncbi:6-bladed beta-propeller [Lutimonas vermicola]|uniref:6-bladed beta-propeller n=1 Tax=Lutimonas vermicola TaxID=414288 RepID=A0ABU9L0J4_9FLAO
MIIRQLIQTLTYYCCLAVFLFHAGNISAQDTLDVDVLDFFDQNQVRWIKQIPEKNIERAVEKKGWLKRLLLGKGELTSFQKPMSVIPLNRNENIVLDQGNGTIFFTDESELEIPRLLRKSDSVFPSLVAACMMPNKDLLFTDSKLNMIYVLNEDQKKLKPLHPQLKLQQPTGIAYAASAHEIWVVETGAHQVSILDLSGNKLRSFGQRGSGPGEFNYPTSIWIDKQGQAYVVDALNYRIQIFDAEGNFVSMFGENGNGTGFIASPKGIATDSHGHIYLVDALFHGVQIFDQQGNYLYQFGKQGRNQSEFWMPSGIFIDQNDHIYVADSYNKRIQVFELIFTK